MTNKKILWFVDWESSQEDFNKVSENAEFKWEFASQWQDAMEKMRVSSEKGTPFSVAFVDSFEKAEWIWKIDPNIQCVIWADSNWNWAQNFKKFDQCDKWLVMKKPFTQWESWQAAKALWKKWDFEQQSVSEAAPSEKKVLVVDDESQIRDIVADMLQQAGFTVVTASNGEEALKYFEDPSFKVDLLLTDIVMPRVTGIRLAETLSQSHPLVPVVFMSGFPCDAQFQKDVEDGQKYFLQKPFSNDSLLKTVQNTFGGSAWMSPNKWASSQGFEA